MEPQLKMPAASFCPVEKIWWNYCLKIYHFPRIFSVFEENTFIQDKYVKNIGMIGEKHKTFFASYHQGKQVLMRLISGY